jgi:hypothetical protein
VVGLDPVGLEPPQHPAGAEVERGHVVEVAAGDVEPPAVRRDVHVVGEPVAALLLPDHLVRGPLHRVHRRQSLPQVRDDVEGTEVGERMPVEEADRAGGAVADQEDIAQGAGRRRTGRSGNACDPAADQTQGCSDRAENGPATSHDGQSRQPWRRPERPGPLRNARSVVIA